MVTAGCNHDKPFEENLPAADTTRTRGVARQLTYNLGADRSPAWEADGSSLLFSYEDRGRSDDDHCLSFIPATGGTIRREICGTTFGSLDSIDTFYEAAANADGQLLYARESSLGITLTPNEGALVLSSLKDPSRYTTIKSYPYPAPSGSIHLGITDVHWLTPTTAIYLAQSVFYMSPCNGCEVDTVRSGIELVKLDLSGPAPAISTIPNTQDASSATVSPGDGGVYFTRNGDSRVFELDIVTGAVTIVHDFGSAGIARDVEVVGTRMVAVVGGKISYYLDPSVGLVQKDFAGQLWEVDLTTGDAQPLPVAGQFFRRPALSPAADRLAAEAYPTTISSCAPPIGCIDTVVSRASDLWLIDLP